MGSEGLGGWCSPKMWKWEIIDAEIDMNIFMHITWNNNCVHVNLNIEFIPIELPDYTTSL